MPEVIVITGASSGFGALAARTLAQEGHIVYASMTDIRGHNAAQVAAVNDFAARHDSDLHAIELDVTSQASADAAVNAILAEQGRLDVVIHNAGHMAFGPAEAFTPEQFARLYDINVLGTQRVNRAALPVLRGQGRGLLIWVSSSSTRGGTPPYLAPYFAAKAAMDSLAVSYAGELCRWGVETSIIVPGAFASGTNHFSHASKPEDKARVASYEAGPYANFSDRFLQGQDSVVPPEADVVDVARAVARVIAMPFGRRPFRVHIDPAQDGAEVVAAVADRIRAEFLRRIGLGDLLSVSTSRTQATWSLTPELTVEFTDSGTEGVTTMVQESASHSTALTEEEIRAIELLYRAFTDKNPDLLDEACTPDWQDIPLLPNQGPGPDGLKRLIPMFLEAFPDLKIIVHEIVGSGGHAGVRASIVGTHRGPIFGVAPTGEVVDVALHEFHHLKGGRITHTWHLEDWFGMLNRIGAWPPLPTSGSS